MNPRKMTIAEFADKFHACPGGKEWAIMNCRNMAEVWEKAKPEWLVWVATRPGVLDDKTLRLFACWCIRQVWHFLRDERSRSAVEVAERYALGNATQAELAAAGTAAWTAAEAAAGTAAWTAARAAAGTAAWAAAGTAAWTAAGTAAGAAACHAQAQYLKVLPNPFVEVK